MVPKPKKMSRYHGSFLLILFFIFFFAQPSSSGREITLFEMYTRSELVQLAGYGEEKLSSVLATGTVLCEVCLDGKAQFHARPVSDASVALTCRTSGKQKKSNDAEGMTDEYGDFIIDFPSQLHANPNLDKVCTIRVLQLPRNSPCRKVIIGKPQGIRLASVGNGVRTYTVGSIRLQQPSKVCPKKGREVKNRTHGGAGLRTRLGLSL